MMFGRRAVDDDNKKRYAELARAREAEVQAQKEAADALQKEKEEARQALWKKQAEYQDKVDVFSGGGGSKFIQTGNVVTRDMLENSQKNTSPAIAAEESLAEAMNDVGNLKTRVAIDMLKFQINEAIGAGVQSYSRNLKKAIALLTTLEASQSEDAPQVEEEATSDGLDGKLDALFGGGYADINDDGIEFAALDED